VLAKTLYAPQSGVRYSRHVENKTECKKTNSDLEFDVHEVPPPCRLVADLGRAAIAVPILVRPCRFAGNVVRGQAVGVRREQCRDLCEGSRLEIVLGDERDDLVAFVASGDRRMRVRQRDGEQKPG
jgi:hypothetical protein